MRNDEADLTRLLRLLAGRIADGQLGDRRCDLGARELGELERNLLGYCAEHAIPLREAEIALLPEARANPDGIRIRRLTRWRETDPLPEYRFEPLGAENSVAERRLLRLVLRDHLPVRRLHKAWRTPANEAATNPETVVYVAECAPDCDVARLHGALDVSRYGDQTEVAVEGEELPPYQAAALAAAQLIWTATPTPNSPSSGRPDTDPPATLF